METLAEQSATPMKNTSAHLRALRHVHLVKTRKEVAELKRRIRESPKTREVIACCRGLYCVYSVPEPGRFCDRPLKGLS